MKDDAQLMLKAASFAAFKQTPESLRHWLEDLAQDVVLAALEQRRKGASRVGQQGYRYAASHAVRRLMYLLRGQTEMPFEYEGDEVHVPNDLGPLPLWRLQRIWDDLTDIQRVAVQLMLSGDSFVEVARENGLHRASLAAARRTVLKRLNEPLTQQGRSRRAYQRKSEAAFAPMPVERVQFELERDRMLKARARQERYGAMTAKHVLGDIDEAGRAA